MDLAKFPISNEMSNVQKTREIGHLGISLEIGNWIFGINKVKKTKKTATIDASNVIS